MKEIGPNNGDHCLWTDFQARHKTTDSDTDNTVILFASEVEKSRPILICWVLDQIRGGRGADFKKWAHSEGGHVTQPSPLKKVCDVVHLRPFVP